ncbi:fibroblast growth factor 7 [Engraulis encrasicolus]|uniref:fibroblast growth factor 7 n=1 Tax=Engraulis encrasicolus TaxID=184585 RepID=UPI002FD49678
MHIWRRTWNRMPSLHLLLGLYCLHLVMLVGSVSLACSDRTPTAPGQQGQQVATGTAAGGGVGGGAGSSALSANCSKHERHTRNYDYMEGGDVRIRRLFSGTRWFLTIDDSGIISGTQDPTNCYSILEIRTVSEGGVLAIKGVKSKYYIAMNRTGTLRGKKEYSDNCNFKEVFLENFYSAYSSAKWTKPNGTEMFISLSQKGKPLRGRKTRKEHISCHFLPRECKEDDRQVD